MDINKHVIPSDGKPHSDLTKYANINEYVQNREVILVDVQRVGKLITSQLLRICTSVPVIKKHVVPLTVNKVHVKK